MLSPRLAKVLVSISSTFPAIDLFRVLYRRNPNFIRDYDFYAFRFAINASGRWAFAFLFLVLACTPVQRIARSTWIPAVRRPLGLAAFGYCLLHFWVYFVMGQKLHLDYLVPDALLRASRPPGWLSMLLLLPLALTSTDGMVKRLGGKRWKQLHRLVYPATALAIYHVYLVEQERNLDFNSTKVTAVIFVVLLALRLRRAG